MATPNVATPGTAAAAGAAARAYLTVGERAPVGALARVNWAHIPPPVKRYAPEAAVRPPAPLVTLLHRAFGFTRYQWDDWHAITGQPGLEWLAAGRPLRPVPSGGGLSSAELYLIGGTGGLPLGAYHYDPAAELLDPLLPGAAPADLGLSGGAGDDSLCLVIGSVANRVIFKYGEFGYRLQCLDAGVLAAQLLTICAEEGLTGQVHTRFDEAATAELLGLEPDAECPIAVVTVGGLPPGPPEEPSSPSASRPRASAPALPTPRTQPARILATHPYARALRAASRGEPANGQPAGRTPTPPPLTAAALPCEATIPLPEVPVDLAAGSPRRRTADGRFATTPITLEQFAAVLGAAGRGWGIGGDGAGGNDVGGDHGDIGGDHGDVGGDHGDVGPRHVLVHCVVHAVAGLERGVYVYDPEGHELHRLRAADLRGDTWPEPPGRYVLGDHRAAVTVFPVGDYDQGFQVCGDRWYQMLNLAAGITAQRTALAAAALGLGSRVTCSYDPDHIATVLGVPPALRPLCQVLVGPVATSVAYTQPLPEWPLPEWPLQDRPIPE